MKITHLLFSFMLDINSIFFALFIFTCETKIQFHLSKSFSIYWIFSLQLFHYVNSICLIYKRFSTFFFSYTLSQHSIKLKIFLNSFIALFIIHTNTHLIHFHANIFLSISSFCGGTVKNISQNISIFAIQCNHMSFVHSSFCVRVCVCVYVNKWW